LAQALGSGQLAGDELKSLNENAGQLGLSLERAVQAILNTNKSLKTLGTEGKLTTPVVLQAFDVAFKQIEGDVKNIPNLFSFQLARLENSWTRLLDTLDRRLKVSEIYAFLVRKAGEAIDAINLTLSSGLGEVELYASRLGEKELFKDIDQTVAKIGQIKAELAEVSGNQDVWMLGLALDSEAELNKLLERRNILAKELAKRTLADAQATRNSVITGLGSDEYTGKLAALTAALKLSETGAENLKKMFPAIAESATRAQIPIEKIIAIANLESVGFTKFKAGIGSATGPMQILEGTARQLAESLGLSFDKIRDGTDDWWSNIIAGGAYISQMAKGASSEVETYAKYFLGPGGAAKGLDYVPKNNSITGREYAEKVLAVENDIRIALGETDDAFAKRIELLSRAGKLEQEYASARRVFDNTLYESLALLDSGALKQETYISIILDAAKAFGENDAALQKLAVTELQRLEDLQTAAGFEERRYENFLQLQQAYDSLVLSLDPLIAAELEYKTAIELLNTAQENLNLSSEEYTRISELIALRLSQTKAEIAETSATVEGLALRFKSAAFDSFNSWIDSAVQGTFNLKDALADLLKQIVALTVKMAIFKAVSRAFGGVDFSGLFGLQAAQGYAFPGGTNLPQGVYHDPTVFKFAKGGTIGLLGEAGSEAILPLTRTSNGDLGVKSEPAQMNIIVNNNARGVEVGTRQVDSETVELTVREIESRLQRGGNSTSRVFDARYRR